MDLLFFATSRGLDANGDHVKIELEHRAVVIGFDLFQINFHFKTLLAVSVRWFAALLSTLRSCVNLPYPADKSSSVFLRLRLAEFSY